MKRWMLGMALGITLAAQADSRVELRLACQAAAAGMPNGSGASVYYPSGRTLTNNAGKAGAIWYYPDGRTLTYNMGVRGASFYYPNGRTLSNDFGNAGATWYYSDGRTMTNSGPELTPAQMAEMACQLIVGD